MYKILEALEDTSLYYSDCLIAYFKAGYGASLGKLDYEFEKQQKKTDKHLRELREFREAKRKYQKFIYKLKKDNLIRESVKNNEKVFTLTKEGKNKLQSLREKKKKNLPDVKFYKKRKNNNLIIVIFDVPEAERKKRGWLRQALLEMGFEIVQKSVWIGKVKIPKEFLEDLLFLNLVDCVEIFEITKSGSLKQID